MKLSRRRFLLLGASLPVVAAVGANLNFESWVGYNQSPPTLEEAMEAIFRMPQQEPRIALVSKEFLDLLNEEINWSALKVDHQPLYYWRS